LAQAPDEDGYYAMVTLRGQASDPEDGTLPGTALRWQLEQLDTLIDLGRGTELPAKIHLKCDGSAPAANRIVLTVTDGTHTRSSYVDVYFRGLLC